MEHVCDPIRQSNYLPLNIDISYWKHSYKQTNSFYDVPSEQMIVEVKECAMKYNPTMELFRQSNPTIVPAVTWTEDISDQIVDMTNRQLCFQFLISVFYLISVRVCVYLCFPFFFCAFFLRLPNLKTAQTTRKQTKKKTKQNDKIG